jgi:dienelactone hydrolase
LYRSNPLKGCRCFGTALLTIFIGLLFLTACGEANPAVPTPAATTTPANPATVAGSPTAQAASDTPVPPTPVITLPPDATPTALASVVPPTVSTAHPPLQPASGPGGQDYPFKNITSHRYGQGDEAYYIFEPTQPAPLKPLPVIAFLHGYVGVDPERDNYIDWITHLVRRGNLLIFPVYQARNSKDGASYTDNALAALKAALPRLQDGSHARPDLSNFLMVGYSAGGVIATNLTAQAEKNGLPVPKALFAVSPGGCANCSIFAVRNFTLDQPSELAAIQPTTKMLVLVGNQDVVVGKSASSLIWQNTPQIPAANKNYLEFQSDNHGLPELVADHGMATRHPPDAFNFYGIWKLFDGLESCSIEAKLCEVALGNTPQQRNLGQWSDGTPVKELLVLG